MTIEVKRVYEPAADADGKRILVDRLWPRGLTKDKARVDFWAKAASPSNELRRWYHQGKGDWDEFRKRYFAELDANPEAVAELRAHFGKGTVTFLFGSKQEERNNATALREYLESRA